MFDIISQNYLEGCINGVTIYKVITTYTDGCTDTIYQNSNGDEVSGAGWSGGACNNRVDVVTTCVEENSNLYYLKFDEDTNTYRVFDFNNVDVTGTVTPTICQSGSISTVSTVGGRDFSTTLGATLAGSIGVNNVRSFTIIAANDCNVILSGMSKTLRALQSYTWSQGEGYDIDLTSFVFNIGGVAVEVIRENI